MSTENPIVPRTVTSEVAASTSLTPSTDGPTYDKMCRTAIAMSEACEAIAKGDSDRAHQEIERGLRELDGVMADYSLDLSEVLPSEICETCGRLATDFTRRAGTVQCGACAHGHVDPTDVVGPVEVGVQRGEPSAVVVRMPVRGRGGEVQLAMSPEVAHGFALAILKAAGELTGSPTAIAVDICPGFVRLTVDPLGIGVRMSAEDMKGFAGRLATVCDEAAALRGAA